MGKNGILKRMFNLDEREMRLSRSFASRNRSFLKSLLLREGSK